MAITVDNAMSTAIWRFHDAALERATLIYTFSRSTYEDIPASYQIYVRQLVTLIDLVHQFCFNARRALERAEKHRPGIISYAQDLLASGTPKIALSVFDKTQTIIPTKESFWWCLGRIIHSKDTQVIYRTVGHGPSHARRPGRAIRQPVAFGFSSDRDSDQIDHYVELERFVLLYVSGIAPRIEESISGRNNP